MTKRELERLRQEIGRHGGADLIYLHAGESEAAFAALVPIETLTRVLDQGEVPDWIDNHSHVEPEDS